MTMNDEFCLLLEPNDRQLSKPAVHFPLVKTWSRGWVLDWIRICYMFGEI